MHELSLAQGLIRQLLELCQEHNANKVTNVTVLIGPFSGIVASSFSFGFDALKQEQQQTRESLLVLETPEPEFSCSECKTRFNLPHNPAGPGAGGITETACPNCGSAFCFPRGGDELILKQLEME